MAMSASPFLKLSCIQFLRRNRARGVATLSTNMKNHYQVLIAGGGTGGCSVAARFRDFPAASIGIIEPQEYHYYQGAWTLVGGGMMDLSESRIPTREAIPSNAEWIHDKIIAFDPQNNKVVVSSGRQIKGAKEALDEDPRVCTNYSADYVEKTFKAISRFTHGTAIFTFPQTPIKCAGAPLKAMFLFQDYLARKGREKDANIQYFTSTKAMFSVKKYAKALEEICHQRGLFYSLGKTLVEVDHKRSLVAFEDVDTKERKEYNYDFLHLTPPMTVPEVLQTASDLTYPEANNFVDVDPQTLRHLKFRNIFSLGDCSSLPTSKTAAAISSQHAVLYDNLTDIISGGSGDVSMYNGYTSCPLITGYNKGILAEFGYDQVILETLPIDQSRERALFAWIKRSFLPPLYWNGLIRGIWRGPGTIRKFLRFTTPK